MDKFRCQNDECIKLHKDGIEDTRLLLKIIDGVKHQYYINKDGSLDHYESDGTGQEVYLQCDVCGQKYEFDFDIGYMFEQHVLPLSKRQFDEIELRKISH